MRTITLNIDNKETFYLSSSTSEECTELESIDDIDILNTKIREIVKNPNAEIIAVGDAVTYPINSNKHLLSTIKNGDYRSYDVPLEQQEKTSGFVTICEDARSCWQSAIRAIGFKKLAGLNTPAYYETPCILWKV